jgi:hypothetical protein
MREHSPVVSQGGFIATLHQTYMVSRGYLVILDLVRAIAFLGTAFWSLFALASIVGRAVSGLTLDRVDRPFPGVFPLPVDGPPRMDKMIEVPQNCHATASGCRTLKGHPRWTCQDTG